MVKPDPAILVPMFSLFVVIFVSFYGVLTYASTPNKWKFLLGMLIAATVYAILIYGASLYDSKSELEVYARLSSALEGAMLYVGLVFVSLIAILKAVFSRQPKESILMLGMGFVFAFFDLYLSIMCVETIPFIDNIAKPKC